MEATLRDELPPLPAVVEGVSRGRCVRDGYQRGWGLQYGNLMERVADDPLYRFALEKASTRLGHFSEPNRMNIYLILKYFLPRISTGNIIEFGSYRGGSAIFMGAVCQQLYPDRRIYALDTFAGMPLTDKRVDAHSQGDFADTSIGEVADAVGAACLDNITLVQGMFQDTSAAALAAAGSIALAHIDCDTKSGCAFSQKVIRPHLVEGAYIVFDDATISSCIGATEAVEEMVQEDGIFSEQIWPHFVFRHGLTDTITG
jgi:predicted O-methyltransferase YrrM